MSEWYEIEAAWDVGGCASEMLLKLGETREWGELVHEVSHNTHATAEEIWDGMASAIRGYLESLDNLVTIDPFKAQFVPKAVK